MTEVEVKFESKFLEACKAAGQIKFYQDLRCRYASKEQWKDELPHVQQAFRDAMAAVYAIFMQHKVELLTSSNEETRKLAEQAGAALKRLEQEWEMSESV